MFIKKKSNERSISHFNLQVNEINYVYVCTTIKNRSNKRLISHLSFKVILIKYAIQVD